MLDTIANFKEWCGLPIVVGAIDATHFDIRKPNLVFTNYYYCKSSKYSMHYYVVIDQFFFDVSLSMSRFANNSCALKCSNLYMQVCSSNTLFDAVYAQQSFIPFLLGDKGYPWLLTPHRDLPSGRRHYVMERLFNQKLHRGRCIIENAFGTIKHSF